MKTEDEHSQTRCGVTPLGQVLLRVLIFWAALGVMFFESTVSREPGIGFGVAVLMVCVALLPWGSE